MNLEYKKFYLTDETVNDVLTNVCAYSNDEIIITDDKFNIIFNNAKLINNFCEKNLFKCIDFIINNDIKNQITDFSKTDKKHLFFKLIIRNNKLLKDIPVNFHICKIKKEKVKGYCIIIQDIIQEIRNRIQKATFIDIISHDLKNPMRANIRILELILKNKFGIVDETLKPVLKELLNSCQFMNYMADNLLIKYKNEIELKNLKKQKYSMIKLIKDSCYKLSNVFDRKKQSVEITVKGNIQDVEIDVKEMSKVVNNLIINASEQSLDNSKILISVKYNNNEIIVSVIDKGYNQKQEILNDMFEEYISCSNKFRKVGFSLEMYNCKKIIEAHNGNISAKNETDNGTVITFSLPY